MKKIYNKIIFKFGIIYFTFLIADIRFGEWQHLTSYITPNDVVFYNEDTIYSTTMGGLLKFDISDYKFNHIGKDKLEFLDLNSIVLDNKKNIFISSNQPDGSIHALNDIDELIRYYDDFESIDEIGMLINNSSYLFCIYRSQLEYGILVFEYGNDNLPSYKDYYNNFPLEISSISDLDVYNDNIIITTPEGIFKGNYVLSNLKLSSNWETFDNPVMAFKYFQNSDKIIIGGYNELWEKSNNVWNEIDLNIDYSISDNFQVLDILENNDQLIVLTKKDLIIFDENDSVFQIPVNSEFTCIDIFNDLIALGVKNNGIIIYNLNDNDYSIFSPNSSIHNQYDAITISDSGILIGAVNRIEQRPYSPTDNIAGVTFFNDNYIENFISSKTMNYYEYPIDNSEDDKFIGYEINYIPGEKDIWSIIEQDNNNLFFCNSGINSDLLELKGGLVNLNINSNTISIYDTTNSVLDGLNGIYSPDYTYGYLTVNQLFKDYNKNLWIINPYSEKNHTIAAIRLYSEENWLHIAAPNDKSYLPQEMTIDMMGLAWFGFQYASNLDVSSVYSEGGIKVLDTKNTFDNTMDDLWLTIDNPNVLPNGKNTSIWSITSDSYNRIWVLTSDGIQGYLYSKNNSNIYLIPLYQQSDGDLINFLSFLSFNKGDKIRIDAQDNIWVTTKNDGVFLILNNTTPLDEHLEFSTSNSEILSDRIFDLAINKLNGKVYFATEKGISVLKLPLEKTFKNKKKSIKITPNPLIVPNDKAQIYNLYPGSNVKILSLNGDLVIELVSSFLGNEDTMVEWDGRNKYGNYVGSGIYLVAAYHEDGGSTVSKIAIIKK